MLVVFILTKNTEPADWCLSLKVGIFSANCSFEDVTDLDFDTYPS